MRDLFLKEVEESDYENYYLIRSEKENLFWTGYDNPPHKERFFNWFKDRIADKQKHLYLLFDKKVCVGSLNVDFYNDYVAIGYSTVTKYEGKGYATYLVGESIRIANEARKRNPELKKIIAWINEQNEASKRVIEKNGFQKSDITEIRKRFGNEELYYQFEIYL
jgi:RimJ/RimL family protein N-acetyltransferase